MELRMYDVFGRIVKTTAVTEHKTTIGKKTWPAECISMK